MRRWIHICLIAALPFMAEAQVFSSKGRFSVEFNRGCSPMTVNITEHDSFGAVTRQYFYFEGAGITNSQTFTYQDAGRYQIVQVVGVDGISDRTDTLFIEAFDPIKPEIQIQKCSGFEISVTSEDTYYDSIRVYFNLTDSVTLLQSQAAEFTYTTQQSEVIGIKGFFNNADEICSTYFEEIVPISTLQTPIINDAVIKETCKDFYSLYLELDAIDTLTRYRINLLEGSSTTIFDGFLTSTSMTLSNLPFSRTDYCVNIEAFDPCNNTSTFSDNFCEEASNLSLSPFRYLYSSYHDNGVYINLDSVGSGTFNVYRKIDGDEFELRSTQTASFTDRIGSIGRRYFYQIDYVDSCGQVLYSAETNPPLIQASKETTNQYLVSFTPANNSLSDIPNNRYQSGNEFSQTENMITNSEFSIQLDAKDGTPRQFITATSSYSDGTTINSNAITVRHELVLYVPTAFTPNGDGLNDTLDLFGLPTETATTNIYTRWGQLIYTSEQPNPGWDGTVNGSVADQGTYLYEIIFETADGEKRMQKGTFALIKK